MPFGRLGGSAMPLAVSADGESALCLECYTRLRQQPSGFSRDSAAASVMWEAALATGFCILARGCEIALGAGEEPDPTQHLVPADVTFFWRDGVRHARLRMRKRKDLKVLRGKQAVVILAGGGELFDAVAHFLVLRTMSQKPAFRGLPSSAHGSSWSHP